MKKEHNWIFYLETFSAVFILRCLFPQRDIAWFFLYVSGFLLRNEQTPNPNNPEPWNLKPESQIQTHPVTLILVLWEMSLPHSRHSPNSPVVLISFMASVCPHLVTFPSFPWLISPQVLATGSRLPAPGSRTLTPFVLAFCVIFGIYSNAPKSWELYSFHQQQLRQRSRKVWMVCWHI